MKTESTLPSVERRSSRTFLLDRRKLVLRFRAVLPSTRDAVRRAVEEVIETATSTGCLGEEAADVEIALREALANAVIHGNGCRPDRFVHLRCYGSPGEGLLIAVRDEGGGFDPRKVPDPTDGTRLELPHGRGIFLMKALMDRTEHRRGGREVVMCKVCRPIRSRAKRPLRLAPR